MPSQAEIQKTQGTRLNTEKGPWETYDSEFEQEMSEELSAQVAEYASKRYADAPLSSESQEVLAEEKERNDEIASQYQWLKPEEYKDLEARIGKVMTHAEFITKLRKAGVTCHYTQHPHVDKAVLHYQKDALSPSEIVGWAQKGQMPELSIMNFDDHGVPLAERRRGWRTVLLQAILKGVITEEKANKEFGKPRQDAAFDRYNGLLKAFRDAGSSLG
jgi:hypothetical protein